MQSALELLRSGTVDGRFFCEFRRLIDPKHSVAERVWAFDQPFYLLLAMGSTAQTRIPSVPGGLGGQWLSIFLQTFN